jgi:hypothetical protein
MNHHGKEKFDCQGEEEEKIGRKILFDSTISNKRNEQSSVVK